MEDLIKRKDAIKAEADIVYKVLHSAGCKETYEDCLADAEKTFKDIPSAENKGEWIEIWEDGMSTKAMCNNCKRESDRPLGNFCKWCGARMVK